MGVLGFTVLGLNVHSADFLMKNGLNILFKGNSVSFHDLLKNNAF